MPKFNRVTVEVDSINIDYFAVTIPVEDNEVPDFQVAAVHRLEGASDEQWQFVVSAVAAALNDDSDAARSIRNKARLEVDKFIVQNDQS